ncbi:MAG: hypothetical protein C4325_00725, partial [Blastocatellia bacterium]
VTPMRADMTNYSVLDELKKWEELPAAKTP